MKLYYLRGEGLLLMDHFSADVISCILQHCSLALINRIRFVSKKWLAASLRANVTGELLRGGFFCCAAAFAAWTHRSTCTAKEMTVILRKASFDEYAKSERDHDAEKCEFGRHSWPRFDQFDDMPLDGMCVLRGLYAYGLERPSDVQRVAIAPLALGCDVLVQSSSGTGKTATYAAGLLHQIDPTPGHGVQAIVLCPTRELSAGINHCIKELGRFLPVSTVCCTRGDSTERDVRAIESEMPHIVVGTPGRIFNLLQRGTVTLSKNHMIHLVLDEADEMVSISFRDLIEDIFDIVVSSSGSHGRQVAILSATMPEKVEEWSRVMQSKPVSIVVKRKELTLGGVRQYYIDVEREEWKLDVLCDLSEMISDSATVLIFCNTRRKVESLKELLIERDLPGTLILGSQDLTKGLDDQKLRRFIVSTDVHVQGRGIDVSIISLVINFDLPKNLENYIHRCGHWGRFGSATCINFVTAEERDSLRAIEQFYATQIEEMPADIRLL